MLCYSIISLITHFVCLHDYSNGSSTYKITERLYNL
jgi:hypothetical protein